MALKYILRFLVNQFRRSFTVICSAIINNFLLCMTSHELFDIVLSIGLKLATFVNFYICLMTNITVHPIFWNDPFFFLFSHMATFKGRSAYVQYQIDILSDDSKIDLLIFIDLFSTDILLGRWRIAYHILTKNVQLRPFD